jgi:AraC family L-rhamnose operon regulatory protein RhaS
MYRRPDFLVLPELVSLGLYVTQESQIGGPRHQSPDGLEIGYLESGSVEWWDGKRLDEASPGSVLIDYPGDWQGGSGAIVHPCTRFWIRFDFPKRGALPGMCQETTDEIAGIFADMRRRHFPGSPRLKELFSLLLAEQREPNELSVEFSRALFHQLLMTVVRDHQAEQQKQFSEPVRTALSIFEAHITGDVSVEGVAESVGLSTGYFHEIFHRETGYTPSQYHMRRRIDAAKRQLITGLTSVTDIALELGFSSSQYFSTAFRKVVGLTPVQYRHLRASAPDDTIYSNVAMVPRARPGVASTRR